MIIGVLTLTGAASSFAGFILEVGEKSLFLSLVLTMIVCLILGMGIPTIPNYIITSSIAGPSVAQAGRAADRLPHVRLLFRDHGRSDAAGGTRGPRRGIDRQRVSSIRIGLQGDADRDRRFVVPFMAIYDPALMLQAATLWTDIVYMAFKALVAICLWGGAVVGFLRGRLNLVERCLPSSPARCLSPPSSAPTRRLCAGPCSSGGTCGAPARATAPADLMPGAWAPAGWWWPFAVESSRWRGSFDREDPLGGGLSHRARAPGDRGADSGLRRRYGMPPGEHPFDHGVWRYDPHVPPLKRAAPYAV